MKITIVTAVLNGADSIEETIGSVRAQEDPDLEHLIIDGGSTDGTLDILRKHGDAIRWSSGSDGGISDAFNRGIFLATGDIVGILSADDTLLPGSLAIVRDAFEQDASIDVVYGNAVLIEGDRRVTLRAEPDLSRISVRSPFRHAAVFVKRSAYATYGVFNERYALAMDYELLLRFHTRGAKFKRADAALCTIRSGGVSHRRFRDTLRETREISIGYGATPIRVDLSLFLRICMHQIRLGLNRVGLRYPVDVYRRLTGRFAEWHD